MIHEHLTEQHVIGAMLLGDDGLEIGLQLSPADFTLDSHRRIFTRIQMLKTAGDAVSISTLMTALMRAKELDSVGGAGYVADLTSDVIRGYSPITYVRQMKRNSESRRIANLCVVAQARISDGEEPEDVLAYIQGETIASQLASADDRPQSISEWVRPTLEVLEDERKRTGDVLGIPSGIRDLDRVTTGWRDGELTYLGALPGRGKTAFLLQSLYSAACAGIPAGIISLEMRKEQLMRRLAVMHGRISSTKLRDPRNMNAEEWRATENALISLGDMPITGTDVSGLSPAKIARCARQMHQAGARIIFVDFVQIIREDGKERREAINRISATLRDVCKSLNIPFVVASQLARRDSDVNRKPTMQDLRESGNLEQDAHRVLLLYRPVDKQTGDFSGEDEIIIAKQREGVVGSIPVRYDDQSLLFCGRSYRPVAA